MKIKNFEYVIMILRFNFFLKHQKLRLNLTIIKLNFKINFFKFILLTYSFN